MKKVTAVEWLFEELDVVDSSISYELFQKAKQMEKQQIIDCCIKTTQDCWSSVGQEFEISINFTKDDLKNQKKEAEQYYQETFKSE